MDDIRRVQDKLHHCLEAKPLIFIGVIFFAVVGLLGAFVSDRTSPAVCLVLIIILVVGYVWEERRLRNALEEAQFAEQRRVQDAEWIPMTGSEAVAEIDRRVEAMHAGPKPRKMSQAERMTFRHPDDGMGD